MKKIISDLKTFTIAVIGLIGGTIWAVLSHWEPEPTILIIVSFIEVIAFGFFKITDNREEQDQSLPSSINHGSVRVNVNIGKISEEIEEGITAEGKNEVLIEKKPDNREAKIEFMKSRTRILFIDDDKNFNVVKILKNSGWRFTKSIVDIKATDIQAVKDANILFVDINGVGKILSLPNEGLDLALMIKERYPEKKVIIYSANRTSNAFHPAWDICDFKLEKNALPNQFQNLVEQCSIESYNSK